MIHQDVLIPSVILKWCLSSRLAILISIQQHIHISFLCASTRSFLLYSSLCLVHISGQLFYIQRFICNTAPSSHIISCYNTSQYRSAYILASHILAKLATGASISTQLQIISCHLHTYLINGIGITIQGRIISQMKTKSISGLDALCVSSFCNTILDCGYISFISSVGLVGIQVSIVQ